MKWKTDIPNISFSDLSTPHDYFEGKIIYNHFTHMHGTFEGSSTLRPDAYLHLNSMPILEYNGYIPVVHEPSYIDMGSYIHFNPSPVFIPEPSTVLVFLVAAGLILKRASR